MGKKEDIIMVGAVGLGRQALVTDEVVLVVMYLVGVECFYTFLIGNTRIEDISVEFGQMLQKSTRTT